ncbi:MAG: TylF/MycF/NovP-related O-methyltransferase, partial [Leptolyngbyaceae cyanobacterium]
HLIKGWFQDTVPVYRDKVGPIAILRLDGDWYESTKIPLDNFYDLIVPGGAVIVDDYATCFGSRRAVDEFRLNRDIKSPLNPDGRGGVWFEKPLE